MNKKMLKASVPVKPISLPSDEESSDKKIQINQLGLTINVNKSKAFDFESAFADETVTSKEPNASENNTKDSDLLSNQINNSKSSNNHQTSENFGTRGKKYARAATLNPLDPNVVQNKRKKSTGNVKKELELIFGSKKGNARNRKSDKKNNTRIISNNKSSIKPNQIQFENDEHEKSIEDCSLIQKNPFINEDETEEKIQKEEAFKKLLDKYCDEEKEKTNSNCTSSTTKNILKESMQIEQKNELKYSIKSPENSLIKNKEKNQSQTLFNAFKELKSISDELDDLKTLSDSSEELICNQNGIQNESLNLNTHFIESNYQQDEFAFCKSYENEDLMDDSDILSNPENSMNLSLSNIFEESSHKRIKQSSKNQKMQCSKKNELQTLFNEYSSGLENIFQKELKNKKKQFDEFLKEIQNIQEIERCFTEI